MCIIEEFGLTDEYWTEEYGVPELDVVCGAGTEDLDLSASDYVNIMSNTTEVLAENIDDVIPADEIDDICQVREGRGLVKGRCETRD